MTIKQGQIRQIEMLMAQLDEEHMKRYALEAELSATKSKLDTALGWIDGAKVAVELYGNSRVGAGDWRDNMMKQARELLTKGESK